MVKLILTLSILALSATVTYANCSPFTTQRNPRVVAYFRQTHACPATGKVQRTCPGYIVDHIIPLCLGGLDTTTNMQWQTTADSYRKDILERKQCAIAWENHK